ncbi:HEAT repeat domain-containing protein [Herbidospora cretacea]|uniref:HEAT repeat domain-containing protein n=1 Tax=Herbidospora cretacea TaxID=28444 RepID=UPI0009EE5366|nr:HEAT repeat domain-containing protein [Herbidospora cretacea]
MTDRELPSRVLARKALVPSDPDDDERWKIVRELQVRGDAETFEVAVRLCGATEPRERQLGADILAQLSFQENAKPGLPVLLDLARREGDPTVLSSAVIALGHVADERALPEVLALTGHDDHRVRRAAAWTLPTVMRDDDPEATAALIRMTREADDENRECATTGLAGLETDSEEIRAALAARLDDPCLIVAVEAAYGLARRGDRRAEQGVRRYLAEPDGNDYTRSVVEWTVEELDGTGRPKRAR